MKHATIKDIAKIAGVNKSTVSKVINNYTNISEKTRKRILKIIKENNYYPFESAQMLGKRKSGIIAFVSSRISANFNIDVLRAIEDKARFDTRYVHGITPFSSFYDKNIASQHFRKILYGRKADVVIALAMNPEPEILLEYKKAGLPIILIENKMVNAYSVNTDNREGGYLAGEYLLKRGRKRIGLICGWPIKKSKYGFSYATSERKKGFEQALKQYGAKFDKRYFDITTHYGIEEGIEILDKFIKKRLKLDAVFCASGDMTAMGVMEGARKHGLKIPRDLAVMGYDDSVYAPFLSPSLTTIKQPIDKLGETVFNLAVDTMNNKINGFKHIEIQPKLIIRESA